MCAVVFPGAQTFGFCNLPNERLQCSMGGGLTAGEVSMRTVQLPAWEGSDPTVWGKLEKKCLVTGARQDGFWNALQNVRAGRTPWLSLSVCGRPHSGQPPGRASPPVWRQECGRLLQEQPRHREPLPQPCPGNVSGSTAFPHKNTINGLASSGQSND